MTHDRRTFLRAIGAAGIGTVALGGRAAAAPATFTVEGAGDDIWDASDAFHYYFTEVSGDFDVSVEVTSQEDTGGWAKSGLMVRESLADDARNAMVRKTPGNDTSFQFRTETGGNEGSTTSDAGSDIAQVDGGTISADWQRLERSGDTIRGYASQDGSNWTLIAEMSLALPESVFVGLAVTSTDTSTLNATEFANLSGIEPNFGTDVGDVGTAGRVTSSSGSINLDPILSTGESSDLTTSSATVSGELIDLGDASSAEASFEYRTADGGSWQSTASETLSSGGTFSRTLSGLAQETAYEFRAVVETSDGDTVTGPAVGFETYGPDTDPAVTTREATNVDDSLATLKATLETVGGRARSADVWFEYREVGGSWEETDAKTLEEAGDFGFTVFNLTPTTQYEYRPVVEADDGDTATGSTTTFTTRDVVGDGAGSYFDLDDGFATPGAWLDENTTVAKVTEPTREAFDEAVNQEGPVLVVFETSGVIDLGGDTFRISHDKTWVAGQTAPSPGITFIDGMLQVDASDCVVQHIRSRIGPGSDGEIQGNDSFNTEDQTTNNVVDHVTASWGTDECMSVGYNTDRTTYANCLIYEGLWDPYGDGSDHNYATLVGDGADHVTLIGNVWAKARSRIPRLKGDTRSVVVNNFTYFFDEAAETSGSAVTSFVGNKYTGLNANDDNILDGGSAYHEDNVTADPPLRDDTDFANTDSLSSRPLWPEGLDPMSSSEVESHNLEYAGARPADRTHHDERIVQEIRDRAGNDRLQSPKEYWIPDPSAVGGYPDLEVNTHSITVPDSDRRRWLEQWAQWVEEVDVPKPDGSDTGDTEAPSQPTGLATESTASSITVEWTASSDAGGSGLDGYEVYVDGQQRTTVGAGSTSTTISGLDAGTTYQVGVRAVDGAGNASSQAITTATTDGTGPSGATISPSFSMDSVGVDGSAEATISLSEAPEGLAGFDLTVSVDDTSVATIEGASYANDLFEQGVEVADDGSSVSLQAIDTNENIQPGATNVDLATVSLQAQGEGEVTVSVTVEALDADGGYVIDASTTTDTLSVTAGLPPVEEGLPRPQDIDGDGNYEDLNGNDRFDSDDVVLYFNNYDEPTITDHVDAYDFNGNEDVDFDDIVTLFNEL